MLPGLSELPGGSFFPVHGSQTTTLPSVEHLTATPLGDGLSGSSLPPLGPLPPLFGAPALLPPLRSYLINDTATSGDNAYSGAAPPTTSEDEDLPASVLGTQAVSPTLSPIVRVALSAAEKRGPLVAPPDALPRL